jgi:ankyrin repeat protein
MNWGIDEVMGRINRRLLGAALLALVAAPLAAQSFSDGFTFLKAVRARDGAVAERILSNPGSTAVNARDPSTGEGALHILVRGRDLTWLAFMLSKGARPDIQSNDGTTPLILSAQLGWVEGAQQLLVRRANPNISNRSGESPLIVAVQRLDLRMVRLLLSQNANPNHTDNLSGNSAIDYARQNPRAAAILRELQQASAPRAAAPGTPPR